MDFEIKSSTYGAKRVVIDNEDKATANKYNWHLKYDAKSGKYYVATKKTENGKRKLYLLHRVLTNADDGYVVDHINGNTLDNRKENLRVCLQKDNVKNVGKRKDGLTSKYKGVCYRDKFKKYVAQISINKKIIHLGLFETELDAALVYNGAAKLLHGEYAWTNKIN